YTPRGRPVIAQRVRWRDSEESRGSFCSLTTASILSSYDAVWLEMIFFSASRFAPCCLASLARLTSRLTIEVLAMVCQPLIAEREAEGLEQGLGLCVGLRRGGDRDVHAAHGVDLVEIDL